MACTINKQTEVFPWRLTEQERRLTFISPDNLLKNSTHLATKHPILHPKITRDIDLDSESCSWWFFWLDTQPDTRPGQNGKCDDASSILLCHCRLRFTSKLKKDDIHLLWNECQAPVSNQSDGAASFMVRSECLMLSNGKLEDVGRYLVLRTCTDSASFAGQDGFNLLWFGGSRCLRQLLENKPDGKICTYCPLPQSTIQSTI